VDLEELSQGLSEEARSLLYALAAEDHPPEATAAERTVEDINRWLERREARALQLELTGRLRRGEADVFEILRAKQEERGVHVTPPPRTGRTH
jgi:hypothetical protein